MPYRLNYAREVTEAISDFLGDFSTPSERQEAWRVIRTELAKLAADPQSASHISAPYPRPVHRFSFEIGDTTYHKQIAFSFHPNEEVLRILDFKTVSL